MFFVEGPLFKRPRHYLGIGVTTVEKGDPVPALRAYILLHTLNKKINQQMSKLIPHDGACNWETKPGDGKERTVTGRHRWQGNNRGLVVRKHVSEEVRHK